MARTPQLFGWRYVTTSTGWLLWMSFFVLVGLTFLVWFLYELVTVQRDSAGVLVGTFVGMLFGLFPWFSVTGAFVGPTHVRRAPQVGRPTRVRLEDIERIWPVAHIRIGSPAGDLIEVRKGPFAFRKEGVEWFDDFGRAFATLTGAAYEPEARPWPGVRPPLWSPAVDSTDSSADEG